jgi:hypothetical protein
MHLQQGTWLLVARSFHTQGTPEAQHSADSPLLPTMCMCEAGYQKTTRGEKRRGETHPLNRGLLRRRQSYILIVRWRISTARLWSRKGRSCVHAAGWGTVVIALFKGAEMRGLLGEGQLGLSARSQEHRQGLSL